MQSAGKGLHGGPLVTAAAMVVRSSAITPSAHLRQRDPAQARDQVACGTRHTRAGRGPEQDPGSPRRSWVEPGAGSRSYRGHMSTPPNRGGLTITQLATRTSLTPDTIR